MELVDQTAKRTSLLKKILGFQEKFPIHCIHAVNWQGWFMDAKSLGLNEVGFLFSHMNMQHKKNN